MRTATTTPTQQTAAQQGDPKAIASILQTRLHAYAITPKVGLRQQDNLLYIALEAAQSTDPKMVLPLVKATLMSLELSWLNLAQVSGRLAGQATPLWQQELILRPAVNLQPTVPPLASFMGSPVQVEVGGDFSGQLIVGNNNNQNFYSYAYNVEHGGVLNVAAPPQISARPTPINLRPQPFNSLLDRRDILPQLVQALQTAQPIELYAADGFGKTALVRHLMYDAQATTRFSDGVVYTPAHRLLPADLLQALHDAFYESNVPYKPSYTQVQHALQNKQALIVLDDLGLEKPDLDRLVPVVPHGTFVLTSTERTYWGEGVAIDLPGLPLEDSFKLIERELGRALTTAEETVVRTLWQTLKGHPLQLRRIAAHVKQTKQPLTAFIVPKAGAPHTGFSPIPAETVFYTILDKLPTSHHPVLALLGALGGLALTPEQALAIAQVANAETILSELHGLHLVSMGANGYHLCPDLVGVCQQTWPIETWLTSAVEYFTSGQAAVGESTDVLHYLADWSAQSGHWYDCLELSRSLDGVLSLQGRWGQWQQVLEQSLQAAQQTGNQAAEAWSLHQLGTQALAEGNTAQAETALTQALQLRKALGDQAGAAITRHNLSLLVPPLVAPEASSTAGGAGAMTGLSTKTVLLAAAGGVAALVTTAVLLWPLDTSSPSASFTLSAEAMEFGERQLNTASDPQALTLSNTGNSLVSIDRMVLRGNRDFRVDEDSCTPTLMLAPGETCEITVIFTPNSLGARAATMELQLDGKTQVIPLTGAGTAVSVPGISIVPASVTFNEVQLEDIARNTVTINNDGTAPLTIQALAITGEQASDFAIANTCAETTLAPDTSCTVELTFSPSATGERRATLTIENNASAVAVALNGIGTRRPTPPKAEDDSITTQADTPVTIDVLSNDDPVDGELTIVNVTAPQAGQVVVNADNTLTYRPDGEANLDRFTYQVRNGQNRTAQATVTVTIEPVKPDPVPAPTASADRAETEAGQPVTIPVLNNDSGEALTVASFDSPSQFGGTVVQNNDGTLTYRPAADFSGVDRFGYTVRDRNGTVSDPANVEVLVNAAPPPMPQDDQVTTDQDIPVTISVLANDQGDGLRIADVQTQTAAGGVVQDNGNQALVYTPPAGFFGEDRFSYTVRDRNGLTSERAIVTVQVNRINQPPVATDDYDEYDVSAYSEPTEVSLDVLTNDRDPDGDNTDLRIESVTSGEFIKARISNDGRSILYTQVFPPESFFDGNIAYDSLTYTIQDADGAISQTATVEIEVYYESPVQEFPTHSRPRF
ncbi:outer membrane adhesin-like protein [Leptolyngbya sp. Heron Island J]|uniref:Ig-like domain-containing protein n=1 Tax=Leptolyngbya sp. Heron Island J TaxID=1385935 RepID=UPI0003B96EB3|nr:Ig-like domain-containing protein [Leptolyngbya sp. Heron Island J]ESA34636.1 outer membrane adhesin-like protein [Leptolyngbya sp. Heron Island J]